jgi:Tautomerase enzyme
MPFVNISLAHGKSGEYLEAVSRAVHDALVAERRFYKTLVRLLQEGPGVRPADVFVMMT